MLGMIAGNGGGGDLKSTTAYYYNAANGTTAPTTVLNITGSGYITGIKSTCGGSGRAGYATLTIDGVNVWSSFNLSGSGGWSDYHGFWRFKSSCVLTHWISSTGESITTRGFYALT